MCGIAGIVSLTGGRPAAPKLAAMIGTLRHRGPDDRGLFVAGPAALGAARLSIIDVAGGHQPVSIDEGAVTVAQNGEIYNYVELRAELERAGRQFTTACDTEVIAHLYAVDGVAGLERLRGMFAIAIWDAPRQWLVLARDRAGKKPLYYLQHDGELLFGSEAKAILAALDRVPEVNADALVSFFAFGYVAGETAAFDGMRRLRPGTALIVDAPSGASRIETFWRWPDAAAGDAMPQGEAIERLRSALTDAVRIRLRSDVPLGAFLSGGMDSAAVLALMTSQSAQVTPDCIRVAETLAIHYDEPFADASAIPTFYVAELARRHVTVCLTGDGGDELFAGYTPYADALARVASAPVDALRALITAGARHVPVHARGKGRLSTMALGPEAWFVWRRTVFPDYILEAVVDPDVLTRAEARPERDAVAAIRGSRGTLLSRLQQWDQGHYLPDDILVKVDRATMAHSLEARCPILDHHVIELAARQSSARHGDAVTTKKLFREVIRPWVPPAVLDRPKRGFGVPLRRWFKDQMIEWARDILHDPRTRQRGWTRAREVAALVDQHRSGARDHAKRIWALVSLELWARTHVDRVHTRGQAPGSGAQVEQCA